MRPGKITYAFGALAAIAACGALAYHHDIREAYEGYRFSGEEVRVLEQRLHEVESREAALKRQVEELGQESLELEAAIREEHGHVRDGETVYHITWTPQSNGAPATEEP